METTMEIRNELAKKEYNLYYSQLSVPQQDLIDSKLMDNKKFINSRTVYQGTITVDSELMNDYYGEARQYKSEPYTTRMMIYRFYALMVNYIGEDGLERFEQAEIVNYGFHHEWAIYTETEQGYNNILDGITNTINQQSK